MSDVARPPSDSEIRQWAWSKGMNVLPKGAIPHDVKRRWNEDHPERQVQVKERPHYARGVRW